ncbi:MAG: hypothetical protein ACE5L7_11125 [Candidatus Aminicenantales bacterium]
MKIRFILFFTFLIVLGFGFQSIAQFTPEAVAEREKWEEFLKTAIIIGQKQQESREAVTEPWELTLEKNGVTRKALWKDAEGRTKGFVENWRWEIAAYRLDKHLGLNMVPPTVEKRFKGNRGSCQLWVDYWIKAKHKNEQRIKVPSYKVFYYNRATYLRWAWDNLIANEDRHSGNIFITKDWRIILPDHSRSFRTSKKFTKNLIYTEKHKEGPKIMKELPRAFVEKLKSLNFELIRDIVGEYLTEKEINAVLLRRDLILEVVDERIKRLGEDKVLY